MRRLLIAFVAVTGSLVFAVLAAELVLRALDLAPTGGIATVTERQFTRIPGILAPSQRFVDRRIPALPYMVTTDTLGFRGPPFPRVKPVGELRILLVGDSFVYGDFVDDAETTPSQLQRLLPGCLGARVINGGLGSTTITEQVHLIERALSISPDIVVLVFTENDVSDLGRDPSMWDRFASNRRAKSAFPLGFVYPVLRNTALWNLGLAARGGFGNRVNTRRIHEAVMTSNTDSTVARLRAGYVAKLTSLRDELSRLGVPLVFVVFPSHFTLTGEGARGQVDWATAAARSLGLETLDLSDALRSTGRPVTEEYLLPYDGHPSPLGHRSAASAIARLLLATPKLAGRCQQISSAAPTAIPVHRADHSP